MANTDNPRGLYNPQAIDGGAIWAKTYKSLGTEIFQGDPIDLNGAGRAIPLGATTGTPMGVAAAYAAATADIEVKVYTDLHRLTFEIQCDANDIIDDTTIGLYYDFKKGTGDSTTLQSGWEMDSGLSAEDQLELVSLVTRADNDNTLTQNKVRVKVRTDSRASVIAAT